MRIQRSAATLMLILGLAGCGWVEDIQVGPKDQRDAAEKFIALFSARDLAGIEKQFDPRVDINTADPVIRNMVARFPRAKPTHVQVYQWGKSVQTSGTFYGMDIFYRYPDGSGMIADVVLSPAAKGYRVYGIHLQPMSRGTLEANDFSLKGKTNLHYALLVAIVAVIALTIWALVACIRARGVRYKWLWIIFILIGFGKLTVDWTTGAMAFTPMAFQLLSASGMRSGFWGPWVIGISVPIGAIVFLASRRRLMADSSPPTPAA
jgi:hypothetical protein